MNVKKIPGIKRLQTQNQKQHAQQCGEFALGDGRANGVFVHRPNRTSVGQTAHEKNSRARTAGKTTSTTTPRQCNLCSLACAFVLGLLFRIFDVFFAFW